MKFKEEKTNEIVECSKPSASKLETIEEFEKVMKTGRFSKVTYFIEKRVKLSKKDFSEFSENLMDDRDFLKNSSGWIGEIGLLSAILVTDGVRKIVVDTQGFNYARHIAFI